ncbi:hypothetical protein BZA02_11110 [Ruegeria sp. P4]|nr:hypothetical protein BZA02_11110 [Ruegeria sp. P4]
MKRPIVTVPHELLRFVEVDWDIDWRGQSNGDTTGGNSAVVFNKFPRWIGSPSLFLDADAMAMWRTVRAQAQGRLGIYKLTMIDPVGFDGDRSQQPLGFAGGGLFASGAGFAHDPLCFADSDAPAGATRIVISGAEHRPRPGQIMSHQMWPFVVTSVEERAGDVCALEIQMPLRVAIAKGDPIRLQGQGLFEAVEEGMGRSSYGLAMVSRPRLNFREVLNR